MTAVKTVKVLGTSEASWHDAADEAVAQASETTDDIHGVEVEDWTADAVRFWAKRELDRSERRVARRFPQESRISSSVTTAISLSGSG